MLRSEWVLPIYNVMDFQIGSKVLQIKLLFKYIQIVPIDGGTSGNKQTEIF